MLPKYIGQSSKYYLLYEVARKLDHLVKLAPNGNWGKESAEKVVTKYVSRVQTAGGVVEGQDYLISEIQRYKDLGVWDKASLVLLPHGYGEQKLFSIKGPDFGFTRAGTRTRVGPSGLVEEVPLHVPAIDFTGGTPKLSLEPARTNLFLHSQELNNLLKTNATVQSNVIVAPDGTISGDKVVEDATSGVHRIIGPGNTLGVTFTVSGYVKSAGDNRYLQILGLGLGGASEVPVFNPDTGLVTMPATNTYLKSAEMHPVLDHSGLPTGWYRFIAVILSNNDGPVYFNLTNDANDTSSLSGTSYLGDGTSGLYLWGCQVEQGSYATSYIPTGAATASRVADAIPALINISDYIGQSKGSWFVDWAPMISDSAQEINIDDGSPSNRLRFIINAGATNLIVSVHALEGINQASVSIPFTYGERHRILLTYKEDEFNVYVDGAQVLNDISGVVPVGMSVLRFTHPTASRPAVANIHRMLLFQEVLGPEQATALTTIES